jgi:lactoylglutathione lyase
VLLDARRRQHDMNQSFQHHWRQHMATLQHKLRHLAISVSDVAAAQKFFEEAFGMTKAGDARSGVHMTDGVMNVALLKLRTPITFGDSKEPYYGPVHFGMWVDNLEQAQQQAVAAGAVHLQGMRPESPNTYYEVKYQGPNGLVFDLTESGWKGAVKSVKRTD